MAEAYFVAVFFATVLDEIFFAANFFAAVFFTATLVAAFLPAVFLLAIFLVATFFAAVFFAADFFAAGAFTAVFFAVVLVAPVFFAAVFLVAKVVPLVDKFLLPVPFVPAVFLETGPPPRTATPVPAVEPEDFFPIDFFVEDFVAVGAAALDPASELFSELLLADFFAAGGTGTAVFLPDFFGAVFVEERAEGSSDARFFAARREPFSEAPTLCVASSSVGNSES